MIRQPSDDHVTDRGIDAADLRRPQTGFARLVAWLVPLAVLWLVILPWMSQREAIQRELEWLDTQGIDPSAMYYTELEAMKPILQELNLQMRRPHKADSSPSSR
ncbi:hypothetical protein [Planctomicrobium sp. SH664]|uniref:hypothetical protein n=1 Tax=Planctomicrobium sp. SH664 TaxID=3448125 RepID=UPI003F5B3E06